MISSEHLVGDSPNWYLGLKTKDVGYYFGAAPSLWHEEVYVTPDGRFIVYRDQDGSISISANQCLHAGSQLLKPGVHDIKEIRCPVHQWLYRPSGELVATPYFKKCQGRRLVSPSFGIWNGYILGYPQDELDAVFQNFGTSLGLPPRCINPEEFEYVAEEIRPCPYPRALMMINYFDGYHVPLAHRETFDAVTDCGSYEWDCSTPDPVRRPGYSIQIVRARKDVAKHAERVRSLPNRKHDVLGWADFYLWLQEKLPDLKTPIDRDIFAVWASVFGEGYLMPELYCGGLFLAVSSLSVDPEKPETGNMNLVEYYIHKSVPEEMRQVGMHKFRLAYGQSADEDDELCLRLWAAHRMGPMHFNRVYHELLEKGDVHWREWYRRHFVKR